MFDETPVATATPDVQAHVTELEGTIRDLRAILAEERTTQITGSDDRLRDFWARAQQLADDAGHCQVFDQLAEELGGPRRARRGHVHVRVTYDVLVDVENIDEPSYSREDVERAARETGTDNWETEDIEVCPD